MLEVQEPSDWVVQPERFCAGTQLTEKDMWGPLDPETGLRCFDYSSAGGVGEILSRVKIAPVNGWSQPGARYDRIIGPRQTDCFAVGRLTVESSASVELDRRHHIGIATSGTGRVIIDRKTYLVSAGDSFLIPWDAGRMECQSDSGALTIVVVSSPA